MKHSPSWEANLSQLVKKFPAFYGTRMYITAVRSARHLSLSWISSIQSIPSHPNSHLSLGFPSGLFPSGFPTKNLVYNSTVPHMCYMPRPPHSSRFDHPTIVGEEYRSLSSSLCSFLHSPVTSSLLGPNILLSTLFSKTLSLRSSFNVSDHVSHPYKTTNKIIVLYVLTFILLDSQLEEKSCCIKWQQASPDFSLLWLTLLRLLNF